MISHRYREDEATATQTLGQKFRTYSSPHWLIGFLGSTGWRTLSENSIPPKRLKSFLRTPFSPNDSGFAAALCRGHESGLSRFYAGTPFSCRNSILPNLSHFWSFLIFMIHRICKQLFQLSVSMTNVLYERYL